MYPVGARDMLPIRGASLLQRLLYFIMFYYKSILRMLYFAVLKDDV